MPAIFDHSHYEFIVSVREPCWVFTGGRTREGLQKFMAEMGPQVAIIDTRSHKLTSARVGDIKAIAEAIADLSDDEKCDIIRRIREFAQTLAVRGVDR